MLINFDSHPDLSVPSEYTEALHNRADKDRRNANKIIFKELNKNADNTIAQWIIPLIMQQTVSTVVWMHAQWCEQIPDGLYNLSIGMIDDQVKVSSGKKYYDVIPSELIDYYGDDWVQNIPYCHDWNLLVATAPEDPIDMDSAWRPVLKKIDSIIPETDPDPYRWILGIDCDFHTTLSPAQHKIASTISSEFLERFKQLTQPKSSRKQDQLIGLIKDVVHEKENRARLCKEIIRLSSAAKAYEILKEFINSLDKMKPRHWDCYISQINYLPHHVSTTEEIVQSVAAVKWFKDKISYDMNMGEPQLVLCNSPGFMPKGQMDIIRREYREHDMITC